MQRRQSQVVQSGPIARQRVSEAEDRAQSWQRPPRGGSPIRTYSTPFGYTSGERRILGRPSVEVEAGAGAADAVTGFLVVIRLLFAE